MPLKLNVGVSRKVGLPAYGSVGASCNLELELDATLLDRDLDGFHAQLRGAYVAAHQAVHDELARLQTPVDPPRDGFHQSHGNVPEPRAPGDRSRARKSATPNQVKAILAIARRQHADLEELLRQEHDLARPEQLSLRQASALIDRLKEMGEG
jgi:hypothetical protein